MARLPLQWSHHVPCQQRRQLRDRLPRRRAEQLRHHLRRLWLGQRHSRGPRCGAEQHDLHPVAVQRRPASREHADLYPGPLRLAHADAYGNGHIHTYAEPNSDAHAYTDADCNRDLYSYSYSYGYLYAHGDSYGYVHAYTNCYCDCNSYSHSHADGDTNADANADSEGSCYSDLDNAADRNRDIYFYTNR